MMNVSGPIRQYNTVNEVAAKIDKMMEGVPSLTGGPSRRYSMAADLPKEWERGFPQGAGISPFLSIIALTITGDPAFANLLMYADDGLFYSNR
jgi:hypothetical protein